MDQLYPAFEKARMIRKPAQLVAPIISQLGQLSLPKDSFLHYLPSSKIDIGPGSDYPVFRQLAKPIQIFNQMQLIEPPNQPRQVTFDSNALVRGYFVRNRRFRRLTALDKMPKDDKTLVVANYSLIHHSYKYIRSLFADYNEWVDLMYTVTSTINETAKQSRRNQFIVINAPDVLPAISRLQQASKTMDQTSVSVFRDNGMRMLLEVWKWLGSEPHANIFDRIEPKNYKYVNFVVQDSNQWICINMDRLHWWKQTTVDAYTEQVRQKKVDPKEVKRPDASSYENLQLQKYWLRMLMVLASARSVAGIDADAPIMAAMDPNKKPVPTNKVVEADDDKLTEVDDGSNDEISVKKEKDLEDSTVSSQSSRKDGVKSSEDILREVATLTSKGDEDSSKSVIDEDVNAQIDADLAELETISSEKTAEVTQTDTGEVLPLAVADVRSYEQRLRDRIGVLAEAGLLTAAEYRRLNILSEKYKTIPNPLGGKGTLLEAVQITPEEIAVNTRENVAPGAVVNDPTMAYSSIESTQQKYIKNTLTKHILRSIMHVQNADVILDDLKMERTETVTGSSLNFSMRLVPIEGVPTTLRFPIPEIQEDGVYVANSVRYSQRCQRGDLPIRKVAANKVALTSYYGKFFVYRGRKAINDYSQWIIDEVMAMGSDKSYTRLTDVKTANVFNMKIKAPRSISSLAHQIREFTANTENEAFVFHLDLGKISENFNMEVVGPWMKKGFTPIAISDKRKIVYYEGESFYLISGDIVKPLGELEEVLNLDISSAPAEFAELKIGGKHVPIGMVLAYDYGLTELVKRLKVKTRRVPVGTRTQQQPDEVALAFSDETLLFSKQDRLACLLLGGFLEFRKIIRGFSITDFDQKGVYQNVFDSTGGGTRVLREINLAKALFVDPMTHDVLVQLNQPTDFMGILVYATELLLNDVHKPELDMSEMRIKGYERIAGAVYQEIVKSMRAHNSRPGKSRYSIEMKPFAIWQSLAEDPSIVVVKDINPIEDIKRREEVTFTGAGGRPKDTMTAATREFGDNDEGIISEATKDSGEVGINTYMAPNPQLVNTYGMTVAPDKKELNLSSYFSSSVLASPCATRDDMKRQGFISIQHSHGVTVQAQQENILQTDYNAVIPHRVSELFAVMAKTNGVVKEINADGITIQYATGEVKSYPLGRQYGENAGMTIPHMLITDLKAGKKFGAGDTITYNKGYFKPSTLNPKQVSWCNGTYATFALCEPGDVIEDASVICQELADMLKTEQTKQRTIIVNFDQAVLRLIKEDTPVAYDDVLCIIQDEITSGMDLYDDADIDSLKALGSQAPKAKYDGLVERIEVFYRGDKEDMSESIRKIVNQGDRDLAQRRKASNKAVVTGQVDEGFKVKGNSLPLDSVAIRIYITGPEPAGVGDKIVLVNQLKSIIGKVIKEPMKAKDGTKILGRFSYTSVARRIVNSPDLVGTTVAILMKGAELAVAAYDS